MDTTKTDLRIILIGEKNGLVINYNKQFLLGLPEPEPKPVAGYMNEIGANLDTADKRTMEHNETCAYTKTIQLLRAHGLATVTECQDGDTIVFWVFKRKSWTPERRRYAGNANLIKGCIPVDDADAYDIASTIVRDKAGERIQYHPRSRYHRIMSEPSTYGIARGE